MSEDTISNIQENSKTFQFDINNGIILPIKIVDPFSLKEFSFNAKLDTGFQGCLAIPQNLAQTLNLTEITERHCKELNTEIILANHESIQTKNYFAQIKFMEYLNPISICTVYPNLNILIGIGFLLDLPYKITILNNKIIFKMEKENESTL